MKAVELMARRHIKRRIADPILRDKVTPDYTIGCKRVLVSNDYYPSLTRQNVDVITTGVARIEPNAVVTTDGTRREVDCLIFGTGFHATDPFPRGAVLGTGGVDLVDAWGGGAEAYLGTTVAGFPNFFMVVGPNTGLGHSSMVFMIESQVAYVVDALKSMRAHRVAAIDVRPDVQRRFNDGLQKRLAHAIWSEGGCVSWYLDPKTGKNTTLWPGFTWQFRRATAHFRLADYRTRALPAPKGTPRRVPARTVPATQNTTAEEALDRV
jgi:cation diffusion facilitator CzcD-associated flavoprotein CzcO